MTSLGALATYLGAQGIIVEHSGEQNIFLVNYAGACLEINTTTYCRTIFQTHVFSFDSHLCIYIATHLHRVYLDKMQVVFESNSTCA